MRILLTNDDGINAPGLQSLERIARAGLLDEIVVSIAPVTLGAGRPLLSGRFDLQLLDTGRNVDFVCARYRVVGMLTEDLPDGE